MGEWVTDANRDRTSGPNGCAFCELIVSDTAAWVAKEDKAVAFFPLRDSVIAPGQTLVAPRAHSTNGVLDVDPDDLAATMALVQRVSQVMVSTLGASGVCVLNASGPNSGRSVDHLHFHVVPRYPADGEDCLPWPSGRSTHQPPGDPRRLLPSAFGLITGQQELSGGNMTPVMREGSTVVRQSGPWTPSVHRLLQHLHSAGVPGVPVPQGRTDRHEVLSYVEGAVPAYPMPTWVWSHAALETSARLLRQVHDATDGLDINGPWRSPTHQPVEVICHNDFAPYNLVFEGEAVVGAIDWDYASPGPRLWDLAYLAYRLVPLSTADWGDGFTQEQRRSRLLRILAAYGSHATTQDLASVLRARLLELAAFTDRMARTLDKPELVEHARLYRRDAATL